MSAEPSYASTGLFETLAASAPDAIFVIDGTSTIVFANDSTLRVFGYSPDELIGKPLSVLIPERYRERHAQGMRRYMQTGQRSVPWTGLELPGLRKDGNEIALEISFGEFVDDDGGGRRLFSGFMRDVSDRVKHRAELEQARATMQKAQDEVAAVGRIMNLALASGTFDDMMQSLLRGLREELGVDEATVLLLDERRNELTVEMTDGIPKTDVRIPLGSGLAGRVAASGKPVVAEDLSTIEVIDPVLRREIISLAAVPLRAGGSLIGALHVGSRTRRRFDPSVVRLLEIVGERMAGVLARTRLFHAERAAREAERTLRMVAQTLASSADPGEVMGHIVEAALTVSGALGVFVEQVMGAPAQREVEVMATAGEGTPALGQRVAFPGSLTEDILRNRQALSLPTLKGFGASMAPYVGKECQDCGVLLLPLLAETDVLGALVLLRAGSMPDFDRTTVDRVTTLAQMASVNLQRLATLRESERRREDAEAAARSRDEVLSVVSHDLRNPVSTVAMAASLLSDPALELTPEQRAKQTEIIKRSAARMNRLIEDLLDVARIERGRFEIRRRDESPGGMVSEAVESFRALATEKDVALDCDVQPGLPLVCVDRDRILQALSNYLNNALKFTPEGGRIVARASRVGQAVRFEVRDTGSGVAAADLPHLFNRFWQAKKTAHMGSGLGLAIVKGIVEAHGGRVHAESQPGRGSTFSFDIDAVPGIASG